MVQKLGETAQEGGKNNIAFMANFLIGNLEQCLEILITSNRLPEAAFFAR
jgi:coatomer subunit beta'